ncbi:MAG TPA: diacylglycerol kinase family protein [Terracidiphilus sp.]|nr:diacylglycerol kinase family protein [Terracidiphilus sp.]
MRRVALVDNPSSGQNSSRREAIVRAAFAALGDAGIEVERFTIHGPGSGAALARQAVSHGFDTVVVCGGDGTVHEVMQGLVGTAVALGVIPLGTANALAANLGLSRIPAKALQALLKAEPVQVPVGRIFFHDPEGARHSRYFTVAAGVGPDALLMARMDPLLKRRLGYVLYLFEALRIWISHPFPLFPVSFESAGGEPRLERASQILAVRVRSFGGVLGRLAPGATLHSRSLSVLTIKTRSRLRYMRFLLSILAGRRDFSRDLELITADSVECNPGNGSRAHIFVEADGEVLGHLPVRLELASETLTLLIPPHAEP